jgi:hypothetical protein
MPPPTEPEGEGTVALPAESRPTAPVVTAPRRRWPLALAWALVALCLSGLASLGVFYKQSVDSGRAWKSVADATAADLATTQATLEETQASLARTEVTLTETEAALTSAWSALDTTKSNLDDVSGKYNDASDRIRQLADEKAQVGDLAGFLRTALERAAAVGTELDRCVLGLQELQFYLLDATSYDPDSLGDAFTTVNADCDAARQGSAGFQAWLEGQ